MKKTSLNKLILGGILGSFLILAQTDADAQFAFSVGPKGGIALTTFKGTTSANIDSRSSGFYGVFTNFQIGKVFSLQPEFLMTQRGANVSTDNAKSEIAIHYFDVPVLAKIRLPLANEVIFPHV